MRAIAVWPTGTVTEAPSAVTSKGMPTSFSAEPMLGDVLAIEPGIEHFRRRPAEIIAAEDEDGDNAEAHHAENGEPPRPKRKQIGPQMLRLLQRGHSLPRDILAFISPLFTRELARGLPRKLSARSRRSRKLQECARARPPNAVRLAASARPP